MGSAVELMPSLNLKASHCHSVHVAAMQFILLAAIIVMQLSDHRQDFRG